MTKYLTDNAQNAKKLDSFKEIFASVAEKVWENKKKYNFASLWIQEIESKENQLNRYLSSVGRAQD